MHKAHCERSINIFVGILTGLLLVFSLFPKLLFAQTPGLALFEEPADIQIALDPVDTPSVIRERPVYFRYDVFHADAEAFILNLFDDVNLNAIRDYVEENPSGGFAWIGYLDDVENSNVTLVTDGKQLSGTITLPHVTYHVRPVMDDLHVVREIDPVPETDAEQGPFAQATTADQLSGGVTYQLVPNYILAVEEQAVLQLVNQERSIYDLTPLASDSRLVVAARDHSVDMSSNGYFSHYSLDGRTPGGRISDVGYPWSTYGENIAVGYSTPQAVMNGWMSSSGHRANILSSAYCDIGVGYAANGRYWTQDFGRQGGVGVCPDGSGGGSGGSSGGSSGGGSSGGGSSGGGSSGGGSSGSGQAGVLGNGGAESFSLGRGDTMLFTLELPSNVTTLTVSTTGSGDADVYVKRIPIDWPGDQGYHNQAEFKAPWANGSNELVQFNSPASGTWHVLVHGYQASSGQITAQWQQGGGSGGSGGGSGGSSGGSSGSGQSGVLANGVAESFSLGSGGTKQFTLEVPSSVTTLRVSISGSGDADLYVKRTPIDWPGDYGRHNEANFKAPWMNGSNETVQLNSPASGTWYVLVHGYQAASVAIEAIW